MSYSLKYFPELGKQAIRYLKLSFYLHIHLKFPPVDDLLKIPKKKIFDTRLKLFPTNFTSLRKKLNPRFNPLPV